MNVDHQSTTHAIVLGASVAGLLSARVLADHYDRVTVVERDALHDNTDARKGVPQGKHTHGLLAGGLRAMSSLLPGLADDLTEAGAINSDLIGDALLNQGGIYRPRSHSGIELICMTRPLLELVIRRRVLALPNVTLRDQTSVLNLRFSNDHGTVIGVEAVNSRTKEPATSLLNADLVVDATGRGSRMPGWLAEHGYERPRETKMAVNLGYVTRVYRRQPGDFDDAVAFAVTPRAPLEKRMGSATAVEGQQFLVMQGGWLGDRPELNDESFLQFARSLPAPDLYQFLLRAEPVSDYSVYTFPGNIRRHYENLKRFPHGLLVLGDAWCSFNPAYGQGMTVAALEALKLDHILKSRSAKTTNSIGQTFFKANKGTVDLAWSFAANADLVYPEIEGKRLAIVKAMNWYMNHFQAASYHDPALAQDLFSVAHLLIPPSALFKPGTVWKVFRASLTRRSHGVNAARMASVSDG